MVRGGHSGSGAPTVRHRAAFGLLLATTVALGTAWPAATAVAGTTRARAEAPEDAAPRIQVSHQPRPAPDPSCRPAQLAATLTMAATAEAYVFTVDATFAVCGSFVAAAYRMPPAPANPWPQTLLEARPVELRPGITTIRFRRDCAPTQYDLVAPPTPATIRPDTGPMHGDMAFVLPWSGVADWGAGCVATTTTTTSSTTSTSTTVAPTSTTTTSTTTTVAAGATSTTLVGTTTTTGNAVVLGESITARPGGGTPATVQGSALAATGSRSVPLAVLAAGLLSGGAGLVLLRRRPG